MNNVDKKEFKQLLEDSNKLLKADINNDTEISIHQALEENNKLLLNHVDKKFVENNKTFKKELKGELKSDMIEVVGNALEQVVLPKFQEINDKLDEHSEILDEHTDRLDSIERKLDREIVRNDTQDIILEKHDKRIVKVEKALV